MLTGEFKALIEVGRRLYHCEEYLLSIKVILTALRVHRHYQVTSFIDEITIKAGRLKILSEKQVQGCLPEESFKLQRVVSGDAVINFNQSKDLLTNEQSLSAQRENISALLIVSQAYIHVYQYIKALTFATKSLSMAQECNCKEYQIKSYIKLVNIHQRLGKYFKVISNIGSLLAVGKDLNDRLEVKENEYQTYWNSDVECRALWILVNAYKSLGSYVEALNHAKKYLEKMRTISEENLVGAYSMVGRLELLLGNTEKALNYHQVEMQLCKKFSNTAALAYAYGNLGAVYTAMGQYKLAAASHEQHLSLAQSLSDNTSKLVCIKQIGDMYMHKEELATAIKFYHQHFSIAKMNKMEVEQCQSYKLIATCHLKLSEFHHARHYFGLCVEKAEKEGDTITQFQCKLHLATILKCLGQYSQARVYYDEVIPVLEEKLTKQLDLADSMISDPLVTKLETCYIELQEVLVELGHSELALEVAERHHSRTFVKNQQNRKVVKEQSLVTKSADLFKTEPPLSLCDIYSIVTQQSAKVVMFSVIDEGFLAWVVIPGEGVVKFHRLKNVYNKEVLQSEVKRCSEEIHHKFAHNCDHRALPSNMEEPFLELGPKGTPLKTEETRSQERSTTIPPLQRLYDLLWLPLEDVMSTVEGSDIIIVPDAILRTVPFSCLQDKSGTYLAQRFKIRFLSCLRAIALLDKEDHLANKCRTDSTPDDQGSKFLFTGNPDMPEVEYNGRVWSPPRQSLLAEQELTAFASLFGVEPLTGEQATKDKILQTLPQSSVAHIATYGSFKNATLAFSPFRQREKICPKEDSYLVTLKDIAKITLQTKLVVLNSCCGCTFQCCHLRQMNFDLPMSFVAAGAKTLVMPLWSIPQPATIIFFYRFYLALVKVKYILAVPAFLC